MEIEPSTPVVAKRLWNILRIMFYMLTKGILKSKIAVDLHLMLKKGKLALTNLMFNHQHHLSTSICRSNDARRSFVSPIKEYEFSCSNSPANSYPFQANKRKLHHLAKSSKYNDVTTMHAVQRVLEMLNNEAIEAQSPLVFPGFGHSPMVRQLRVTDSPFSLKGEDCDHSQVDKAAEDFIKKFYKDLRYQKSIVALESPCHDVIWRSKDSKFVVSG